jgi:hypothetical protein
VYPERYGALSTNLQEEDRGNWLDRLYDMFAEEEAVGGLGWAGADKFICVGLVRRVDGEHYRLLPSFFHIRLKS